MPGPLVLLGIPSYGTVSHNWVLGRQQLSIPLGASTYDLWQTDNSLSIAEKRNLICRQALDLGAKYVFFMGDDTIPPPHAFIQMWNKMKFNSDRNVHLVSGVYFSRSNPPQPMLWRGHMQGSYYDWHVGEFFTADWAGCDCLLIDTDALRAVPEPWFSQDYVFGPTQPHPLTINTEDIYFYEKMAQYGYQLWIDSGVQCVHQDRNSGVAYFLPGDWPQATPGSIILPQDPTYLVADIGAGVTSPYTNGKLVRFDIDEATHPDVRCDIHQLPEPDLTYDEVWSRHVLEHFPGTEAPALVREWSRILKIGGSIRFNVPNLEYAMQGIMAGPPTTSEYHWWQLYGQQASPFDFHKNGFTPRSLGKLVEYAWGVGPIHAMDAAGNQADGVGCFDQIEVTVMNEGANLEVRAVKVRHPKSAVLGPEGRFASPVALEPEIVAPNYKEVGPAVAVVDINPAPSPSLPFELPSSSTAPAPSSFTETSPLSPPVYLEDEPIPTPDPVQVYTNGDSAPPPVPVSTTDS